MNVQADQRTTERENDIALADDSALVAMLFEAGQKKAISAEVVSDVLLEALKTGRSVRNVVDGDELLSRRQRESIQRFTAERTRNSVVERKTVGNAEQFPTPVADGRIAGSPEKSKTSAEAEFLQQHHAALPSGSARYRAAAEIGRGGWGVVVRAHDVQLNRDVAVKKLGAAARTEPDVARRFLHEAMITGQLQHPGIVPVYERGISLEDRQPFYAMKLLGGSTLRDVIREYHAAPQGQIRRQLFHTLLNHFVDVCQAIAYAHDRNIVHRDLKPANVVVGEFGETIVVDWGLAKDLTSDVADLVEETVRAGTPMPGRAATFSQLDGLLDPVMTQAGSVIGTPAFMSPEQARGDTSKIDKRSDTYALGVMLYVILIGKPPFRGDDVQTTIKQVLDGDYEHPRLIDKTIPAVLASICTKAMSMDQEARYQSAAELADDIARYQSNEPVIAHHDSWCETAGRWCRRHPTVAATTIAATFILAVSGFVTTSIVSRAHQSERIAKNAALVAHAQEAKSRQEAEQAREQALKRLEAARDAADEWLVGLSGTLQRYPGMEPVREDLINQAEDHYTMLFQSTAKDPTLTLESARSLIRLGDLQLIRSQRTAQDIDAAQQAFTSAATALESPSGVFDPESLDLERLNAAVGLQLCHLASDNVLDSGIDEFAALVDQITATTTVAPSAEFCSGVIRAHLVLGRLYAAADSLDPTIAALETSLEWSQRLPKDLTTAQQHLITTLREDLYRAYSAAGQHAEAAEILNDTIRHESDRLKDSPERPDLLESRAIARMQWAAEQRYLGDDWAAENAYRAAVVDLSDSWKLMFGDHYYSENLAVAQANLGQLAIQLNQPENAEDMLRSAVDQLTGLMQSPKADREMASRLAACNVSLGHVLVLRDNPAAEETIRRSLDIFEYLKTNSQLSASDQLAHGQAIANLGRWYLNQNNPVDAITQFNAAIKVFDGIAAPAVEMQTEMSAALARFDLGRSLIQADQADKAAEVHRKGIELLTALADGEPTDRKVREHSATCQLIRCLLEADESLRDTGRAQHLLSHLSLTAASQPHLHQLAAIALYRQHDIDGAAVAIRRAQANRRFPDGTDEAIVGCILAIRGDRDRALECLKRCEGMLRLSAGNSSMSSWVTALRQLTESE